MIMTNKFKTIYWICLIIILPCIVYIGSEQLTNSNNFYLYIFIAWLLLILTPFYIEIRFLGIRLKKDVSQIMNISKKNKKKRKKIISRTFILFIEMALFIGILYFLMDAYMYKIPQLQEEIISISQDEKLNITIKDTTQYYFKKIGDLNKKVESLNKKLCEKKKLLTHYKTNIINNLQRDSLISLLNDKVDILQDSLNKNFRKLQNLQKEHLDLINKINLLYKLKVCIEDIKPSDDNKTVVYVQIKGNEDIYKNFVIGLKVKDNRNGEYLMLNNIYNKMCKEVITSNTQQCTFTINLSNRELFRRGQKIFEFYIGKDEMIASEIWEKKKK